VVGEPYRQRDDRQRERAGTGRRKDRTTRDLEIGNAVDTAVFVDDAILRVGGHSSRADVVATLPL
jgi:hypothetical protein